MSDLQIVLIVLGGFIIAGVVAYNWMQERKLRDNISEDFAVAKQDVLAEEFYVDTDALVDKEFAGDVRKDDIINKLHEGDDKQEPSLHDEALPTAVASEPEISMPTEVPNREVKSVEDVNPATTANVEPQPPRETVLPEIEVHKDILPPEFQPIATSALPDDVHSQIDLTAFLYASKNMRGETLKTMQQTTFQELGALVLLHGLDQSDVWYLIDASTTDDAVYKQVACSMQLADRRGPVPKAVLNKFQFAVETAGLEQNAHVEWQGKADPAKRAVDLDKFCLDVDQLISVHLLQGDTPIHGTKFKGLAEANGMQLKGGQFCFYEDSTDDIPQFILINADDQPFTDESLRSNVVLGATFQIEIPKVSNSEQAFNEVVVIAQKMANSLGARMVDDNQKPLGDLQIEKIRQQLKVIHATMVARGVMPGSASSTRLFN